MTAAQRGTVRITIVSDNVEPVSGTDEAPLRTAWGFACVVDTADERVLFDTGSDGPMLIGNMRALGIDPQTIDVLVLSHEHWDHTGGIDALLESGARPVAYVPRSFSAAIRERLASVVPVVEVGERSDIGRVARTTGEIGTSIVEQGIAVPTRQGSVVVTGCAHPGIAEMVRVAAGGDPVALVVGGFHLKDAEECEIDAVIDALMALGVGKLAPTHCTGERATARIAAAFGERFISIGVGSVIEAGV